MHAYLITGNKRLAGLEAKKFIKKSNLQSVEFPIAKIAEIKDLIDFAKIPPVMPTAIIMKDFDKASIEAQNALLKLLEEPQKNLVFILTAMDENKVLPTVVSRCQIIISKNTSTLTDKMKKDAQEFIKGSKSQKLAIISKISSRERAINLLESILVTTEDYKMKSKTDKALTRIKQNANVGLQMSSLVLSLGH